MISTRNTAIYAKEKITSKYKNDITFLLFDFKRIVKKIISKDKDCIDKKIKLSHEDFNMKANIFCNKNNVIIDTFISYKEVFSSHREIISK